MELDMTKKREGSEKDWIWSSEAAMSNYNNVILSKKVPLEYSSRKN